MSPSVSHSAALLSNTLGADALGRSYSIAQRLDFRHEREFERLLVDLDQPSRCSRFGFAASNAALVAHAGTALNTASNIIGIYIGNSLRGVLEIYQDVLGGPAEVALVVDQQWRRRGLGTALLQAATHWAGSHGVACLRLIFSRHNWPMRQFARKANAEFDLLLDELRADIAITSAGREMAPQSN